MFHRLLPGIALPLLVVTLTSTALGQPTLKNGQPTLKDETTASVSAPVPESVDLVEPVTDGSSTEPEAGSAPTQPRDRGPLKVAVTISGGISLGAYEAGLNWALVRFLATHRSKPLHAVRPLELDTITGASAGSINTLLSSLSWCKAQLDPAWHKPFLLWLDVGLHDLVPNNLSRYQSGDGMLSRRKINALFDGVDDQIQQGGFRENCSVKVGVTVTADQPQALEFGQLQVKSSRQSVLWTVKSHAQHQNQQHQNQRSALAFTQYYKKLTSERPENALYDGAIGEQLYLRTNPTGQLYSRELMDVLKASSAIQGAFGLVELWTCERFTSSMTASSDRQCLHVATEMGGTWRPAPRHFSDGGFFDNTPLGLALALVHGPDWHSTAPPRAEYIFFDPDLRRGQIVNPITTHEQGGELGNLLQVLQGLVSSARSYELATVRRYWQASADGIKTSSRYHPLAGERLSAFGAFLSRSFREYDYLVGMYDAARFITQRICDPKNGWGLTQPAPDCEPTTFERVLQALGFGADSGTEAARKTEASVRFLRVEEEQHWRLSPSQENLKRVNTLLAGLCKSKNDKRAKSSNCSPPLDGKSSLIPRRELPVFSAVYEGARTAENGIATSSDWVEAALEREGIGHLLKGLAKVAPACTSSLPSYDLSWGDPDEKERRAECETTRAWAENPGIETRRLLNRVLERQREIERLGNGSGRVLSLMQGALRQEEMMYVGSDRLNGGSAPPDWGWQLMPYHLSAEGFRSGVMAGWRFGPSRDWLTWNVAATPVWARLPATRSAQLFMSLEAGLAVHTRWPWLSGIDANAVGRARLDELGLDAGTSLASYWFFNKLRLAWLYFPMESHEVGFTIGASDIAGLLALIVD